MDALARFTDHPSEYIQIMARLRQNDGCCLFAVVPVAPHVRVTHVCVLDRLQVLNADNLTNGFTLNEFTKFNKIRCVPQHVAHGNNPSCFLRER